ncbi:hypothetical protein C7Y72_11965 [Paraconexibacter algicola]|jgi:hypothetical protein|uniref:Flagellar protein FliL n=1 Tax=Paraconexibacter algicola TaxID=2133960 RepID=A0A2T4UM61_9ACTN|nr:hypothetical protein C7Y72_11965 [Paraconexibacter algicola]
MSRHTVNVLKIALPIVLLLAGAGYKFAPGKPAAAGPPPKVEGEVYVLPREFLIALEEGRFAKLGVALVLEHDFVSAPRTTPKGAPAKPPPGFGTLEQEAVVRAIITETLTDMPARRLATTRGRARLKRRLCATINRATDVKVEAVLFTDLVVQ